MIMMMMMMMMMIMMKWSKNNNDAENDNANEDDDDNDNNNDKNNNDRKRQQVLGTQDSRQVWEGVVNPQVPTLTLSTFPWRGALVPGCPAVQHVRTCLTPTRNTSLMSRLAARPHSQTITIH